MASFWSQASTSPTRKYRFRIGTEENNNWWWATSATKPTVEINSNEYQLINHKFKYPGIATWGDVTISIVDPGTKTKSLYDMLIGQGYDQPTKASTGISKKESDNFVILQLDSSGETIETWTLHNSFIKSINFGDLDYSSDELVRMEIIVGYDWAELE